MAEMVTAIVCAVHTQETKVDSQRLRVYLCLNSGSGHGLWGTGMVFKVFVLGLAIIVLPNIAYGQVAMHRKLAPRIDCTNLVIPNNGSSLYDWRDLVELEHCDRMQRLLRLSPMISKEHQPYFYEASILAGRLPIDVNVNIPILRVVFPERVFFDTDSSTLRPEAELVASIIANSLRLEPPDVVLFVAGHADKRGSRAYNQNLSVDRANALAESILNKGVNVSSVWRVGFGEDLPLASGNNSHAYGLNRRIEFLFAARAEAVATWLSDNQLDILCQGKTRSETNKCKAKLDFQTEGYVVEEVIIKARLDLDSDKQRVDLNSENRILDLSKVKTVTINPVQKRRIRIDPINRKSGLIERG